jgi:glycosyltransferase involved in cell wall biosynthesis
MAHHLETVLEAARLLRHNPRVAFLLAGGGAERGRLLALKEELGLENVVMLDQQPKARMPALWAAADVSLVLLKRNDLFRTVIPSKIFESMAMERPIILGVEGEAREIVEAAGCGVPIEPENAAELAAVVTRLAGELVLCRAMAARGREYVTREFDRAALAARFERMLIRVAAAASPGAQRQTEPA